MLIRANFFYCCQFWCIVVILAFVRIPVKRKETEKLLLPQSTLTREKDASLTHNYLLTQVEDAETLITSLYIHRIKMFSNWSKSILKRNFYEMHFRIQRQCSRCCFCFEIIYIILNWNLLTNAHWTFHLGRFSDDDIILLYQRILEQDRFDGNHGTTLATVVYLDAWNIIIFISPIEK